MTEIVMFAIIVLLVFAVGYQVGRLETLWESIDENRDP